MQLIISLFGDLQSTADVISSATFLITGELRLSHFAEGCDELIKVANSGNSSSVQTFDHCGGVNLYLTKNSRHRNRIFALTRPESLGRLLAIII